ncbi:MAG: TatD family hydrolase [Bacteroidales bacterium]|jgi:TatD DNase family protein
MNFIDTHTHLFAEEFDTDREIVIQNAINNSVTKLLLPAIDRNYYERMMSLSDSSQYCYPMIGLHPTSVKENFSVELEFVKESLEKDRGMFFGIGEIGIDLYWDKTYEIEQTKAFDYQLDLAVKYHLPVSIHTRNSFEIALELIRKKNNPGLKGVFHCFSGSVEQAHEVISLGFMLGIGGIVTYKNSGLQKVVDTISLNHLVLETDSPWLSPVPHRGQRNESAYIPFIAGKIAEIKNIPLIEVAEVTTKNALTLFNLES